MEYPDGDLMTLSIRWNTIKTVKSAVRYHIKYL